MSSRNARGRRHPRRSHPARRRVFDVLAVVVLIVATLAPGVIRTGSPLALLRIPAEALLVLVVLFLLPWRWARRLVAAVASVFLTAAIVLAALDRGFESAVDRDFNVVSDWPELGDGYGVLQDSIGTTLAALVLTGLLIVGAGILVGVYWALLRTHALAGRHRRPALAIGTGLTAGWLVFSLLGAQLVPGVPVAASDTVSAAEATTTQADSTLAQDAAFARSSATDAYAGLPASDLLTKLRGKDVLIVFVESYGQVAVQGTPFSKGVDAVLRQGEAQLTQEGYQERSAFLTSSTFGGISWLAHATLQTGLWVDSQQRYDQVTATDRFTLSDAFREAGWRTVADDPSNAQPWPVGSTFYHYDQQLNAGNVGYRGVNFGYARVPDEYTLQYFQQHELAGPHQPVMAEIDLVSSHIPWNPLPKIVPWASVGDGSEYAAQHAADPGTKQVWQSAKRVQQAYGESIQYSLQSLFAFLQNVDDPNLVTIVLGDHQPWNEVSGANPNHDVPISVIAKDPSVIDGIASWNWQAGIFPSPSAPVWRMDAFRDRFLAAYD